MAHLVLLTDVVELEAPGVGPHTTQDLEVLEEAGPRPKLHPAVVPCLSHRCRHNHHDTLKRLVMANQPTKGPFTTK